MLGQPLPDGYLLAQRPSHHGLGHLFHPTQKKKRDPGVVPMVVILAGFLFLDAFSIDLEICCSQDDIVYQADVEPVLLP